MRSAPEPSSSMTIVSPCGGGGLRPVDHGSRPSGADLVRGEAEIAESEDVLRLLLGAHDPLERWVARLVDGVGNGHDAGQGRLDEVVAVLRLTLHSRLPVGDLERRRLRDRAAGGAARRPPPRARPRPSRRSAGRRGRDPRLRARAPSRARGWSRPGRSRRQPRQRRERIGRRPWPAPCAATCRPARAPSTRTRPRLRPPPPDGALPRRRRGPTGSASLRRCGRGAWSTGRSAWEPSTPAPPSRTRRLSSAETLSTVYVTSRCHRTAAACARSA